MTPRAAAGTPPLAAFGAGWVALGRMGVILTAEPVGAPFMNVFRNIEQAVRVG